MGSLAPVHLLTEQRFPLYLSTTLPEIRALYDSGKAGRWNPHRSIDWSALAPESYDPAVREAARLVWSRRSWIEATGLTETPALLIRMCMQTGREIDPKFFLTVRNTEEAWHVECFDRLAQAFGGRITRPSTRAYEAVFNRNLHRRVLDGATHLDSHIAVHAAFEDGLELQLCRAHLAACGNPTIRAVLAHVIADKERHAAFGFLYIEARARHWSDDDRASVGAALQAHVLETELKGYHCPWLAPEHAAAEAAADARIAEAGLGGASRAVEEEVLFAYVRDVRARMAGLGVVLPWFETNRMRGF